MALITSSRPVYEVCSAERCGRYVLYQDYINVLVQAGVDPDRLRRDLLFDDTCCVRHIFDSLPFADDEYVERLAAIKAVNLRSPPSFYRTRRNEEVRPSYSPTGGISTKEFLGAEPYYYLVERGENPRSVLRHLRILDPRDVGSILAVTDRPETDFECPACGENIPHYRYASYLRTHGEQEEIRLASPDRLSACCAEAVTNVRLTPEEEAEMAQYIAITEPLNAGLPIEVIPSDVCMSCGDQGPSVYHDYSWLVHRGVPSVIALNYFGLHRPCCRQSTMNPSRRVLPSRAVLDRELRQQAEVPQESAIDYDYQRVRLPSLSGNI